MPVYSGKDAYVNGVPCVQSWNANPAVTAQRYSASCVAGATNTPAGITNWTGQIAGVGAQPPLFPDGVPMTFLGVINNTSGSLKSLNGSILIEQLTIDINKETYAPISWVATFGAQGALTEASTGAADSVVSDAPNGKDLIIEIAGTPLTQKLRTAQLVFRRPMTTYPDAGLTYREAGNLECDVNFSVYESSLEVAAYAPNALSLLDIFVDATDFWSLSKMRFLGKTGINFDRVGNNITGYTVNAQWNAVDGTTPGFILGPDGTYYYGEEP